MLTRTLETETLTTPKLPALRSVKGRIRLNKTIKGCLAEFLTLGIRVRRPLVATDSSPVCCSLNCARSLKNRCVGFV